MSDEIMKLMSRYQWLTASVARYVLEKNIDYEKYFE